MHYSVHHITRFRYSVPIRESLMEVRLRPVSDRLQRLHSFHLTTSPRAQLFTYPDDFGNAVYHFDIPREHDELTIEAVSKIEVGAPPPLPETLSPDAWDALKSDAMRAEHFEMLAASALTRGAAALDTFLADAELAPLPDPLHSVQRVNETLYRRLAYESGTSWVDRPLDEALKAGRGISQDFSHLMIAILRRWGIPARFVSGYVHHRPSAILDRSAPDESHAWAEAFLPGLGWVGFDPANDCLAEERHIRVAYGRDYADAPPTRGVFKGNAASELAVAVTVTPSDVPHAGTPFLRILSTALGAEAAPVSGARLKGQHAQQ